LTGVELKFVFPLSIAGSWSRTCRTPRGRGPSAAVEGTVCAAAVAASRPLVDCLSAPVSAGRVNTMCAQNAAHRAPTDPAFALCVPKKRKQDSFLHVPPH
jgi:hypothetical protein